MTHIKRALSIVMVMACITCAAAAQNTPDPYGRDGRVQVRTIYIKPNEGTSDAAEFFMRAFREGVPTRQIFQVRQRPVAPAGRPDWDTDIWIGKINIERIAYRYRGACELRDGGIEPLATFSSTEIECARLVELLARSPRRIRPDILVPLGINRIGLEIYTYQGIFGDSVCHLTIGPLSGGMVSPENLKLTPCLKIFDAVTGHKSW